MATQRYTTSTMRRVLPLLFLALTLPPVLAPAPLARQGTVPGASATTDSPGDLRVDPAQLQGLRWRSIGPAVFGGRVTAVAGVPGQPNVMYVGHASGGLFRSADGGITFESIFDSQGTTSIGALAVAPGNPDVVYVGTGEGNPRNSASFGDGVYRSRDGGRTWRHLGLSHTERFARIVVDPGTPSIVYAAAPGHEWGPNEDLYTSFKPEELARECSAEKLGILQNAMTLNQWDGRLTRELQFVRNLRDRFPEVGARTSACASRTRS